MKLQDCRNTYKELSGKASDVARSLAFAAIAIVWIFRVETDAGLRIPAELFLPGFLAVLALSLDLLQYVAGTIAWGLYSRFWKELRGTKPDDEFKAPRWINWPANTLFALKLIALALGYAFLLCYLVPLVQAP